MRLCASSRRRNTLCLAISVPRTGRGCVWPQEVKLHSLSAKGPGAVLTTVTGIMCCRVVPTPRCYSDLHAQERGSCCTWAWYGPCTGSDTSAQNAPADRHTGPPCCNNAHTVTIRHDSHHDNTKSPTAHAKTRPAAHYPQPARVEQQSRMKVKSNSL